LLRAGSFAGNWVWATWGTRIPSALQQSIWILKATKITGIIVTGAAAATPGGGRMGAGKHSSVSATRTQQMHPPSSSLAAAAAAAAAAAPTRVACARSMKLNFLLRLSHFLTQLEGARGVSF
jgi:hypothetical protein